jgi:hypothetical protein
MSSVLIATAMLVNSIRAENYQKLLARAFERRLWVSSFRTHISVASVHFIGTKNLNADK